MGVLSRDRHPIRVPLPVKERGLGDIFHAVTAKIGLRECSGCKRRRAWLNRVVIGKSGTCAHCK